MVLPTDVCCLLPSAPVMISSCVQPAATAACSHQCQGRRVTSSLCLWPVCEKLPLPPMESCRNYVSCFAGLDVLFGHDVTRWASAAKRASGGGTVVERPICLTMTSREPRASLLGRRLRGTLAQMKSTSAFLMRACSSRAASTWRRTCLASLLVAGSAPSVDGQLYREVGDGNSP